MSTIPVQRKNRLDYTIACICPMGIELAPVEAMLDEIHEPIPSIRDHNAYTLGEVSGHNVVLAIMPEIGNNAAAATATQLLNDFPSIRFALLVGVAGGVPGEADVRLGDVVVSQPTKTFGGVVQFDLGKRLSNGAFERIGQLNKPPAILNTSVRKLEARHRLHGSSIPEYLREMLHRYPRMQEQYSCPTEASDRLFSSDYVHPVFSDNTCNQCEQGKVLRRAVRLDNEPRIHYGTIGSANVVVKDSAIRDELRSQFGILCLDMEAAGFLDTFPCLVIRGICDYADSHKNKSWQPYAAAVAAAYVKELLSVVPLQAVADTAYAVDSMREINEEIPKLCSWINAPTWAEDFELKITKRAPGTALWIVEDARFRGWQQEVRNTLPPLSKKILSIHAKPGYGKTILAAAVIEHLAKHPQVHSLTISNDIPESVLYYFFDKQRLHSNHAMDAVRALLVQFINHHKEIHRVRSHALDIKRQSMHGQSQANSSEIIQMLNDLLMFVGPTFIVLDAVDECTDDAFLFTQIPKLLKRTPTGLLLFGRPSVSLPDDLVENSHIWHLGSRDSERDIKCFLFQQFEQLVKSRLFETDSSLDHVVLHVAQRANGMFLWAKLLLDYLRLPIWTLRERQDAVFNLTRLEGLDTLYLEILSALLAQFPGKSHTTLTRLFQWIANARRPLKLNELKVAISIPYGRSHSYLDEIPNFASNLGKLSGSLIEVTTIGTVQFVHTSLLELLTDAPCDHDLKVANRQLITSYYGNSERNLASDCLSYLWYTLPARPLAGSSKSTPSPTKIDHEYPFLNYSTKFWSHHLVAALAAYPTQISAHDLKTWKTVSDMLQEFLADKNKMTAWVEAIWLYESPQIETLPEDVQLDAISNIPALSESLKRLSLLSEELRYLRESWSQVLLLEPNEIWEPSITSFKKSRFWANTKEAQLVRLAPLGESSKLSITVYSHIADSGKELGVIRLFPPGEFLIPAEWTARYELWQVPSTTKICSVDIRLPPSTMSRFFEIVSSLSVLRDSGIEDLRKVRRGSGHSRGAVSRHAVSLPVAISNDVRRAVIGNFAVHLHRTQREEDLKSIASNASLRWQALNVDDNGEFTPFREDIGRIDYEELFFLKFSPSAEFLAIVRESKKTAAKGSFNYGQLWWLQIFVDKNFRTSSQPEYIALRSTTFFAVPEISILDPSRGLAFHPTLPRLAFPQVLNGLPQTYVWDFNEHIRGGSDCSNLNPFPVSDPPIVDPYFAGNGDVLCGTVAPLQFGLLDGPVNDSFCSPIVVEIPVKESDMQQNLQLSILRTNARQRGLVSASVTEALASGPKAPLTRANCLSFERDTGGIVRVSQLRTLTAKGAVVLRSLGQDRTAKVSTITRVPKEVQNCIDVSLLNRNVADDAGPSFSFSPSSSSCSSSSNDDKNAYEGPSAVTDSHDGLVHLVLNKAHKRYYTEFDVGESVLPALVKRQKESIPTIIKELPAGHRRRELAGNSWGDLFD